MEEETSGLGLHGLGNTIATHRERVSIPVRRIQRRNNQLA